MIRLRALLYNLGFTLWTLLLCIGGLPAMLLGARPVMALARLWVRGSFAWLRLSVGLGWELRGGENLPAGPMIVAVKHQSAWDTLVLNLLLRDPAVVYKRELRFLPLVGQYIWRADMIPIDRKAGATALRKLIADAKRSLDAGRPVAIFPEGTRGPVGGKLPYQPGVGALYTQLGVPLVPVALNSGLFWGRNAFTKLPGTVVLEVLPPIPSGLDRRKAMVLLEERIEGATARLVEEGRRSPGQPVRIEASAASS